MPVESVRTNNVIKKNENSFVFNKVEKKKENKKPKTVAKEVEKKVEK